ncbi:MAG: hypothetical protein AB8B49_11405 [Nitratireductor sp.]
MNVIFEPEKVLASQAELEKYETQMSECLVNTPVELCEITAFTCIRLCFGELHIVDRKFETYAGQIKNGDFNLIIEDLDWQVLEYDQVLVHSKMEQKEVEVLLSFLVSRRVESVSVSSDQIEIMFDGDTRLVAKNMAQVILDDGASTQDVGIRWYFSKGEEWLMTYNTKDMLELTSLTA